MLLWSLFVIGCFTSIVNASIGIVDDDSKLPTRRIARTMCSDPGVNGEIPLQTLGVTPSVKKVSTFNTVFEIDIQPPIPFPQMSDVLVENSTPHSPIQTRSPTTANVGPPAPPPLAMAPSPPPRPEISHVTGWKCFDQGGFEILEATITLPEGWEAVPVFEEKPNIDPTTHHYCRMIPLQLKGVFQMVVSKFEQCGVRKCGISSGEILYCLLLRFPRVQWTKLPEDKLQWIKLPEDKLIEIRCRPDYRTVEETKVLSVDKADESGM